MKIAFNQVKCIHCGCDLNICEGDVLQFLHECLEEIVFDCENCGRDTTVKFERMTADLVSIKDTDE